MGIKTEYNGMEVRKLGCFMVNDYISSSALVWFSWKGIRFD